MWSSNYNDGNSGTEIRKTGDQQQQYDNVGLPSETEVPSARTSAKMDECTTTKRVRLGKEKYHLPTNLRLNNVLTGTSEKLQLTNQQNGIQTIKSEEVDSLEDVPQPKRALADTHIEVPMVNEETQNMGDEVRTTKSRPSSAEENNSRTNDEAEMLMQLDGGNVRKIRIEMVRSVKKQQEIIRFASLSQGHACSVCNRGFRTRDMLRLHFDTRHKEATPVLQCSLCRFASIDQQAFAMHVLNHQERKYKCNLCSRIFRTRMTMKLHARNHRLEGPIVIDDGL